MKAADIVIVLDALVMIVMGILGYVSPTAHKPSVASLIAGVGIGVLLLATIALAKKNPRAGRISAAVVAILPLGQFLPKLIKEPKLYPDGIICFAGLFTFAFLLGAHFVAMSRRSAAPPPAA